MFKEKGYEEFLAKKIAAGLNDIENDCVLTLEASRQQTKALIERKIKELEQTDGDIVYG